MTQPAANGLRERIVLARVTEEDFEELVALRIAAMRESLKRLGRFDPERARERLRGSFCPEHTQFILLDGARVGFYAFRPAADGYHLDHLYVHPGCQSRGVGSEVLGRLLVLADKEHKPVFLGALRESGSNRFYRRHGFVQISEDQWDIYYRRSPAAAQEIKTIHREATGSDAEAICRIYNHYVLGTTITFEEEAVTVETMGGRIAEVTSRYPWLVCEVEGKVVGYAYATGWRPRTAYRYSVESTIYLDAAICGRGLGAPLYADLIRRLREGGFHRVMGGVALPNEASVALHERLGFKKVAQFTEVGWKFGRWIDVGYWELELGPEGKGI